MDFWKLLFEYVTQGGQSAIIVILLGSNALLIWDRKSLLKSLTELQEKAFAAKDNELKSLKEIIDKYHEGQLTVVQALNEIRLVLTAITR